LRVRKQKRHRGDETIVSGNPSRRFRRVLTDRAIPSAVFFAHTKPPSAVHAVIRKFGANMSSSAARHADTGAASDSLSRYLEEIAQYPLLTREQEAALSRRIQAGDEEALHHLVCGNLRFVVAIAKRYRHQGVAMSDLVNEGNIGLMRAAQKYDHEKGVKFISYAVWWIRQSIVQAVSENGHSVRVPVHRAGAVYRLGRRVDALRQELGREPTQRELAEELQVSPRELEQSLPIARSALSLNAPAGNEGDLSLLDVIADDKSDGADEPTFETGMMAAVHDAMDILRPREAKILKLYFGFDARDPMTLEGIGQMLGITRERVRQIKERALSRIRRSKAAPALASFAAR
jgi:RNA polymerase primary sigma factor